MTAAAHERRSAARLSADAERRAGSTLDRLTQLRGEAERILSLTDVPVSLPRHGQTYEIAQPDNTDRLLDRIATDPEQNLPYWAEIWPSGIALADELSLRPNLVERKRVLEIGSGLGITAIAALHAGADLTVTDYAPESLILSQYNALRNTNYEPASLQLNWRRPSPTLFDLVGTGFPVILAADILYESRDVDPLLALITRLLTPDGLLCLAEPGRPVARRFLDAARDRGWRGAVTTHRGPWPDPKDEAVVVHVHMLRLPLSSHAPPPPA